MRIVTEGRRQRIGALALLAAAAALGPGDGSAETAEECSSDADCATVLCPCNWIPISTRDEAALASCRDLQEISRCGTVTPDGRPQAVCRAGLCRDASADSPAASPNAASPAPRFSPSDSSRPPLDGVVPLSLVDSGELYDGMTIDDAIRLLGEPARESAELVEWRYDASAERRDAVALIAAKRGSRLYDWRTGSRPSVEGKGGTP